MILIEINGLCCGRTVLGNQVSGVDIGPDSTRSFLPFADIPASNRVVLKVSGRRSRSNRYEHPVYRNPALYLIESCVVKCEIAYDRSGMKQAKSIARAFMVTGELPGASNG